MFFFFNENMIINIVNDAENIQIIFKADLSFN